jgi:Tfp pilus assembly protein PilO
MKAKILLVPLMAVISMALVVWLVYPAITNGTDGLKEKYAIYQQEKERVAQLAVKSLNVEKLSAQLASSTEEKGILFKFLPEKMKEEEIIDNLNFLAGNNSLSVSNLSVSQPEPEVIAQSQDIAVAQAGGLSGGLPGGNELGVVVLPDPKAREFAVNFSVMGEYEKIKSLLGKMNTLERFNGVKTLSIKRLVAEDAPAGILQADMVLGFNFLKQREILPNAESSAFDLEQFDMKVISDIKNSKDTEVLQLKVDQTGKGNPFLP